jgi:hypothetical protein
MTKVPQAKGINFRSFAGAFKRMFGPEELAKLVELLPPELGKMMARDGFVTGSWYPLEDFRMLHLTAQKVTGRGLELTRALARESALDDFRGIYRVLTFVLSPEFVMRRTSSIWSRYYDVGTVTIDAKPRVAYARFENATGFDRILWQDVIGGSTGVLEACGAKQVKVTVLGGGGDEDNLSVKAEWR